MKAWQPKAGWCIFEDVLHVILSIEVEGAPKLWLFTPPSPLDSTRVLAIIHLFWYSSYVSNIVLEG